LLQLLVVILVKGFGSFFVYLRVPVEVMPLPAVAFLLKVLGLLAMSMAFAFPGLAGSLISQPGPRGLRQRAFAGLFWLGIAGLPLLVVRQYRLLSRFDAAFDFAPFGLRTADTEILFTIFPNTPLTLVVSLVVLVAAFCVTSWL